MELTLHNLKNLLPHLLYQDKKFKKTILACSLKVDYRVNSLACCKTQKSNHFGPTTSPLELGYNTSGKLMSFS